MDSTERLTLSLPETADLLGISRWVVQRAAHDGSLLPSVPRRSAHPVLGLVAWLDGQQDPAHRIPAGTGYPASPALAVLAAPPARTPTHVRRSSTPRCRPQLVRRPPRTARRQRRVTRQPTQGAT